MDRCRVIQKGVAKKIVIAGFRYCSGVYVGGLKKTTKTPRIYDVQAKIQTEHRPNMGLVCHRHYGDMVITSSSSSSVVFEEGEILKGFQYRKIYSVEW
jgi:hypothetical protein